jgi:hypothetical protein
VVLGRARLHHALVAGRSHAQRGTLDILEIKEQAHELLGPLPDGAQRRLERAFGRLRAGREITAIVDDLALVIAEVFEEDER